MEVCLNLWLLLFHLPQRGYRRSTAKERQEDKQDSEATSLPKTSHSNYLKERKLTVKLSLNSCMISVLSLYDSSLSVSSSAMASSKA